MNNTPDRALMQEALERLDDVTETLAWLNSDDDGHIMERTDRARETITKLTARLEQPDAQPVSKELEAEIDAALGLTAAQPVAIPAGYKLMPIEPTPEIARAYWRYNDRTDVVMREAYAELLNAAPAVTAQPVAISAGYTAVKSGWLQMVVNTLRADAAAGRVVRGEMADELEHAVFNAAPAVTPTDVERDAARMEWIAKNLYHDGYAWWTPDVCVQESSFETQPGIDTVRKTIDAAMKEQS